MGLAERAVVVGALLVVGCGGASTEPGAVKPAAVDPTAVALAPVPLRRLTREEYNNTVRDLLADASRPADAFPPDEAVGGFESNNVAPVTPPLVERYMHAAEKLAASAVARLDTIAPCDAGQPERACAARFIDGFGRLAFRRPLEDGERAALRAVYQEKAKASSHAEGIGIVIETVLQSPQFLYRVEPVAGAERRARALSGFEVATRLSYFIWASTPDAALLDDAERGRLATPEGIEVAARRLLSDRRAEDGIRSFHRQWLGLAELEAVSKDGALGATLTPSMKAAMVEETLRFATHAVLAGGDTVQALLTSSETFANGPLAKLYGATPPAEGFARVQLPREQRAGLLTQASVMTVLSNADQTAPILRGKFVRERFLCQVIPPPPPSVNTTPPEVDPKRTTKERFAKHRTDPSCAACHDMMDPIGFGFEHYDAVGAWRATDGAFPVDAVGTISQTDDANGSFDGAVALGARLAASEEVRHCFAKQWFRFALGRSERDGDAPSIATAYAAFARGGFDVRELIVGIARSEAFSHARFEEGGGK